MDFPAFFESRTATLSLINALMLGVSLARRRDTIAALRRHEMAWSAHKTYANEDFQHRFNAAVMAFEAPMRSATSRRGAPAEHAPKPNTRRKRKHSGGN